MVLTFSTGFLNPEYDFDLDKQTIETNILGFVNIGNFITNYFIKQKFGHFVGISSIGGLRGGNGGTYNSSKAFVINYLEGLEVRIKPKKLPIYITDIRPGFVDTQLVRGKIFWMSSVDEATKQIIDAIDKKKSVAYITKRWNLIAILANIWPRRFLFF